MVITVIVNAIAVVLTSLNNNLTLRYLADQIRLDAESLEQTRPVDFWLDADVSPDNTLRLRMTNSGVARIVRVSGELKFYFVFPDGEIRSRRQLEAMLRKNGAMLEACRAANLLVEPTDVQRLLGTSRVFTTQSLESATSTGKKAAFEPELSQSAVRNAVHLSDVLKGKVVMRWRIEYQHAVSRQRFTSFEYLLLEAEPDLSPLRHRLKASVDLARSIGGKALIEKINDFENTSLEDIFGEASK